MKILQINSVYGKGSTGRIVKQIHNALINNGFSSFVCYGRGKEVEEENVFKVSTEFEAYVHSLLSRMFGNDLGYSFFSTRKLIRLIEKISPDIVHIHCLNCHYVNAYTLLRYLKKKKIKTVITHHAETMFTAGCEHSMECQKWENGGCNHCKDRVVCGRISNRVFDDAKKSFLRFKGIYDGFDSLTNVGVSQWITDKIKSSVLLKNSRAVTLTNGIDTESFSRKDESKLRSKLGIADDKKIVLHVTPDFDNPIKGGHFVLELARKMPDYLFVVVGSEKETDLENVIFIGHTNNKSELAEYYSTADCFICTSYCETYPTVCLEAVSCGCKVVGFDVGGIKEIIPEGLGEVVPPYNMELFEEVLKKWCNETIENKKVFIKSESEFFDEYMSLYDSIKNNK